MIKYSLIVPIFNDGDLASDFVQAFEETFQNLCGDDWCALVELIFVNDGSVDNSRDILATLATGKPYVRVIELSRNFGQHIAITCGYHHAQGNYVGMLNVDMQDPPSEIPLLLETLENGEADIAIGVREQRRDSLMNRVTSIAFNYLLRKLTGYDYPINVATLRVMNRKFLDAYNRINEQSPFIPGLEGWLGFQHRYVPIAHNDRRTGKSSYTTLKRLMMAINSIISFSDVPLRLAVWTGLGVAMLGFLSGLWLVATKLFFVEISPGFTSTTSLILFMSGIIILVLGIASLYIGRILQEVQNRPLYIVRDTLNLSENTTAHLQNAAKLGRLNHR